MRRQLPIIYFFAIEKGRYIVTKPVFIINDNLQDLTFTVAVDDEAILNKTKENDFSVVNEDAITYGRRSYLTSTIKIRLHQKSFRERVLRAYKNQCALCKLKHTELLDAASSLISKKFSSYRMFFQNFSFYILPQITDFSSVTIFTNWFRMLI